MLGGKRILIVEDEPLIALDLEATVIDCLGTVVGPVRTLAEAQQFADSSDLDAAILDLRLADGLTLPVIERLHARGIPFVIHSGTIEASMLAAWPNVQIVSKPALAEKVVAVLAGLMKK